MSQLMDAKEIVPGKILYHVYGVNRTATDLDDYEKYIVTSKPDSSGCFKHICVYNSDGEQREYHTNAYLRDNGIGANYNLNRLFLSAESANEFIKELRADKFSNELNTEAAVTQQKNHEFFNLMLGAFDDY